MPDAGLVERLAHRGDLAHRQDAADGPAIRLKNIVRLVDEAFAERVESPPAFAAGNGDVHFAAKPGRSLEVVSRKRLFQPVDARLLERLGGGQSGRVIPDYAG